MKTFPNNSRVCFIGDSITNNNGFVSYIFNHYYQNHKSTKVEFYNCGVSGGTAKEHIEILNQDTLFYNPTHAVIMLGVNDSRREFLADERDVGRYQKLVNAFENYKKNIETLCNALRDKNIEIILCTPAPYDEFTISDIPSLNGGYALIQGYSEFIREFGKENNIAVCDYNKYLTKVLQSEKIYFNDHVHLNPLGQFYMAKCFLNFQGEEIGEFFPIPEYLNEWREVTKHLRNVYVAEHFMIHVFPLQADEGVALIKEYLKNTPNASDNHKLLAEEYFIYKPMQNELKNKIVNLAKAFYK